MSNATNSTKKLGLSQFIASDRPAWLVDYNGDMQKIDEGAMAKADFDPAGEVAQAGGIALFGQRHDLIPLWAGSATDGTVITLTLPEGITNINEIQALWVETNADIRYLATGRAVNIGPIVSYAGGTISSSSTDTYAWNAYLNIVGPNSLTVVRPRRLTLTPGSSVGASTEMPITAVYAWV